MTRLGLTLITPALLACCLWASWPLLALWAPIVGTGLADSLRIVAAGCAGALGCLGAGLGLAAVIGARGLAGRPASSTVRQVAARPWPGLPDAGASEPVIYVEYEEVVRGE